MPRKPGPQLSREDVVQAAARLLEREGYDRLTMRGEHWDIRSIQNIRWKNREQLLYCKRIT